VLVTDVDGNLRLFAANVDGQDAASAHVLANFGRALDLAQLNGNLYLGEADQVVRINPDGTVAEVVAHVPPPNGIVGNPRNGHLFVAGADSATIFEVDPIAHSATPFVTGVPNPDGLAISPDGATL